MTLFSLIPDWILGWTGAILGFGFLVLIHELGHFWALKNRGLPVFAFSIGFGSPIAKRLWNGTEYRLGWMPLGGYVMPEDPDLIEQREQNGESVFPNHSPGSQIFVALMGPVANLLLAFSLFAFIIFAWGNPIPIPVVESIVANSPAATAGLLPGDKVLRYQNTPVNSWAALIGSIQKNKSRRCVMELERNGHFLSVALTPKHEKDRFILGIMPRLGSSGAISSIACIPAAASRTLRESFGVLVALARIVTRQSSGNVAGPLAILDHISKAAQGGFVAFISFLAILSVNLAIFNLLPFPPLDGIRIFFASWHWFLGKPPKESIILPIYTWGTLGLALLFLVVTMKDIQHFFM